MLTSESMGLLFVILKSMGLAIMYLAGGMDMNKWGLSKIKRLTQHSSGALLSLRPLSFALGVKHEQ
jgi:hypothetical protein